MIANMLQWHLGTSHAETKATRDNLPNVVVENKTKSKYMYDYANVRVND